MKYGKTILISSPIVNGKEMSEIIIESGGGVLLSTGLRQPSEIKPLFWKSGDFVEYDEADGVVKAIHRRIKPIDASKSGLGESLTQTSTLDRQVTTRGPAEKKDSGASNWTLRVLAAGGLFWVFFTSSGAEFVSSILRSLTIETDISRYDCELAASLVRGESLQNVFGGQFKIISVSNLSEVSKTDQRIVCTGAVDLSNGSSPRMRITVEKGSSSSEVRFRVEPL